MKKSLTPKIDALFCVCLVLIPLASAQTTTATLLGTVRDRTGAVLAKVNVAAKSDETGLRRTVTTDNEGRYRFAELTPGKYEVQAEMQGFTTTVRNGIVLTVGRESTADFTLNVGGINEKIIVTSGATQIENTNPTISGLVNQRTIQELPINGRDVFQLTTLQTGVIGTSALTGGGGGLGNNPTLVGSGNSKISVNGARITANQFLLDGTTVNDAFNNTPGGLSGSFLGVDALLEFQVITNSYGAEYGQAGGAVINAVTRSGTNNLHGAAYWFHRNSVFDTKNRFDPPGEPIPPFKRNQFGGSLGGPVIKDKTFIFGNYEGLRQDLGVSRIFTVPTTAARARAAASTRPYVNLYPQANGRQLNADTSQYIRPAKYVIDVPSNLAFIPGHPMGGFFSLADVTPLSNSLQVPRRFTYNVFEFSDQATWTRSGHTVKLGGLIRRVQFNSLQGRAADGVYIFPNLNSFLAGQAQAFVAPKPGSNFYRGIRQTIFAPYLQDDWKVRPNLTLNFGLRYETFATPTEVNGLLSNLRQPTDPAPTLGEPFIKNPSHKNFAPRVGFAWQPLDTKTSIRGGFGIFDVILLPFNYRSEMTLQPPYSVTSQIVAPPFPNGYDRIANDVAVPEFSAFLFETERSYVMQYNLSIQRELGWDAVVSLAYVGSRGVHLARRSNINLRTDYVIRPDGSKFYPQIPSNQVQARLRNPLFGQIRMVSMDANTNYNGMQLNINKRFSRNFEFTVSYTWAKAIDDAADYTGALANVPAGAQAQDTYNVRDERGRSTFDVRHNFASGFVYELPFGAGLTGLSKLFSHGWQFNGYVIARTGFPFNPLLGFDRAQEHEDDRETAPAVPGRGLQYIQSRKLCASG